MPDNPKFIQAQKDGKAPLEFLITELFSGDAAVHALGAGKYGIRNWRKDKIKASTYKAAILRHLRAWAEGEDIDYESGYSHLYHIRACCGIVLDSEMQGTLIDDRLVVESKDAEPVDNLERAVNDALVEADVSRARQDATARHHHGVDAQGGPWDVVFTIFADNNTQESLQRRGPYETLFAAREYAKRNPERLAGFVSIHNSKTTLRNDNA